jgi:hypothetical protein
MHTAEDLARFARSLNNHPRKTLRYMKPSERLASSLRTPVEPTVSSINRDHTRCRLA